MEALNIAKPFDSICSACSREGMPAKVRMALRTLLLSTSEVPGTEGRKSALRFDGRGNNLKFGAAGFFVTPNFADVYHPLVLQLLEGPGKWSHLDIRGAAAVRAGGITSAAPTMPPLERMHQIVALDPRAQAKFFLLMTELHYRYIQGVERLHIGRKMLAFPSKIPQDEVAASLQPSVAPGTIDVQAPFEAQGRGFVHGHGKGHSIIGPTLAWLRSVMGTGLRVAGRKLREALLSTAQSVQYEAANEVARQLGLRDVAPEPFTLRQRRQSRMDGCEEEDGTRRHDVAVAPPVVQPHVEQEQACAAVQNRMPALGSAVYRDVALTGSFQSTFPFYRLRSSFLCLGGAPQPADPAGQLATAGWRPGQLATAGWRRNAEIFTLDEDGVVLAVKKSDGSEATTEEKMADAGAWAVSFSQDFFRNHCINHEHDCNDTCVKYVKRKLEAKESLRSHKTPSCRFWFFRIIPLKIGGRLKRVRRRGKPLVQEAFVDDTDDRNQRCRCQVKRDQPFRSTTNDVSQVSNRCNVDFQFLMCAPVEAAEVPEEPQLGSVDVPKRRRLTKKTPAITKAPRPPAYRGDKKNGSTLADPCRQKTRPSWRVSK